jgi:hypothetical protein
MSAATKGAPHPQALSKRTRQRILSSLRMRAIAGDIAAAEALIRLGQQTAIEPAESASAVRAACS